MKLTRHTVYMAVCGIFEQAIEADPWCDARKCRQCAAYIDRSSELACSENVELFKRVMRLEP